MPEILPSTQLAHYQSVRIWAAARDVIIQVISRNHELFEALSVHANLLQIVWEAKHTPENLLAPRPLSTASVRPISISAREPIQEESDEEDDIEQQQPASEEKQSSEDPASATSDATTSEVPSSTVTADPPSISFVEQV